MCGDHRTLSLFKMSEVVLMISSIVFFLSPLDPVKASIFCLGRNNLNLQVSGVSRFSNFTILAMALAIGRTSKSCLVVLGFGTVTKRRATSRKAYRLQGWVEGNRYLPLRFPGIDS